MRLRDVILRDDRASQPAANTVPIGTLYYVTDEGVTERSDGSSWEDFSDDGSGGITDGDKGDITVSAGGTVWTIDADVVTGAKLTASQRTRLIQFTIDGGGAEITTGVHCWVRIPVAGTITSYTLLADQTGSISIDAWKDTYANYPPTDADSITNGNEMEIAASNKAEDTDLGNWSSVAVVAGDIIMFNVDSVTDIQKVWGGLTLLVTA